MPNGSPFLLLALMQNVVFLHGFCENKDLWVDVIPKMKEEVNTLVLDLPGFGGEAQNIRKSIQDMTSFVFEKLDEQNWNRATVVGHSMGGYVALEMLHQYPNRIDAVALVHSHAASDSTETRTNRDKQIDFLERNEAELFLKPFSKSLIADKNVARLENRCFSLVRSTQTPGITAALEAMKSRTDHRELLRETTKPMLWIIGKYDAFIHMDNILEQTILVQHKKVVVMENVGHLAPFEEPLRTANELNDFLKSVYST